MGKPAIASDEDAGAESPVEVLDRHHLLQREIRPVAAGFGNNTGFAPDILGHK
jgi:hypothetical protein